MRKMEEIGKNPIAFLERESSLYRRIEVKSALKKVGPIWQNCITKIRALKDKKKKDVNLIFSSSSGKFRIIHSFFDVTELIQILTGIIEKRQFKLGKYSITFGQKQKELNFNPRFYSSERAKIWDLKWPTMRYELWDESCRLYDFLGADVKDDDFLKSNEPFPCRNGYEAVKTFLEAPKGNFSYVHILLPCYEARVGKSKLQKRKLSFTIEHNVNIKDLNLSAIGYKGDKIIGGKWKELKKSIHEISFNDDVEYAFIFLFHKDVLLDEFSARSEISALPKETDAIQSFIRMKLHGLESGDLVDLSCDIKKSLVRLKRDLLQTNNSRKFEKRVEKLLNFSGFETIHLGNLPNHDIDMLAITSVPILTSLIVECTISTITEEDVDKVIKALNRYQSFVEREVGSSQIIPVVFSQTNDIDKKAEEKAQQIVSIIQRQDIEYLIDKLATSQYISCGNLVEYLRSRLFRVIS